ncbi:MAG: glutathione S-transferase family protein [Alphaproteobacteria bacterium]|nr:glutathione S-transferase family protein [Alphaproteobacteria bacterium]
MRTIHGSPFSRTNYVIWTMKELGLDYNVNPISPMAGETRKPEYLVLNPNGLVPTLEEDGFVLWESLAINFYLAKNNGNGKLWADNPHHEAKIMQWCIFGAVNVDKPAVDYILHKNALPEEMREVAILNAAEQTLIPLLQVVEGQLADGEYLVDNRFTLADLTLAAILDYPRKSGYDLSPYPAIGAWLDRCLNRPARIAMSAPV